MALDNTRYVVGTVLLGDPPQGRQNLLDRVAETYNEFGLKLNTTKTNLNTRDSGLRTSSATTKKAWNATST